MGPTATLAAFASGLRLADVPEPVRHEARRALLNVYGCVLGGSRDTALDTLLAAIAPFSGPAQVALPGRGIRLDALSATLAIGYASNILDFDDTHLATVIHPGPPVLPPLLALAQWAPGDTAGEPASRVASGADLLAAFVVGVEVACRVGGAVTPGHYERGWHITATCGVFGAAAAAGRLLGLDAAGMTRALGIAATEASGLTEMLGSMSKSYNIARAAQNGLLAAMLAQRGYTSSPRALEAPRGFAAVLGPGLDEAALCADLGRRWEVAANTYKPYPCGIVLHPVIDACLGLRAEAGLAGTADPVAAIERVELVVHPLVTVLTGRTEPASGLEAKLSYTHSAAIALIDGAAGVDAYTDAAAARADVLALRARVAARTDAAMPKEAATARVVLRDGRCCERQVAQARGSRGRPMSDAELDAKFHALAAPVLGAERARWLAELCWYVDRTPNARLLAEIAEPAP